MSAVSLSLEERPINYFRLLAVYLILASLTWLVFGQTLRYGFVEYDDPNYVYQNPNVTAGLTSHGVAAAFTQAHARNWHPLTTLSHMLDCQVFGLNPAGHHFTNVLLQTLAVLFLFSAFRAMTGRLWCSTVVAAVFAVHPLHVESVAWIAERKDVLSALFFMLTLGAYARYTAEASRAHYFWVLFFFALGLMSKPMLVTMPILLLLLDYWPLQRILKLKNGDPRSEETRIQPGQKSVVSLVIEKLPLLALSLLSVVATLLAQRTTIDYAKQLPFFWRVGNASVSCLVYIRQTLWPLNLTVFYSQAGDRLPAWEIAGSLGVILGISSAVWMLRRSYPYLFTGWFWYLISLLPVLGLVPVGLQAHADRYAYLPQIGLCFAITWLAADLFRQSPNGRLLLAATAPVIVALLSWRAFGQTTSWRNTETLWRHTLEVDPQNDVAHYNLGLLALQRGQPDEAIAHFEQALKQSGDREISYHVSASLVHNNLGIALASKADFDEAIAQYRKSIELRDTFADAHVNLATLLERKGETAEAIAHYEKAVSIPPEDAKSHVQLGAALAHAGRKTEAGDEYRRALPLTTDPALIRRLKTEISVNESRKESDDR